MMKLLNRTMFIRNPVNKYMTCGLLYLLLVLIEGNYHLHQDSHDDSRSKRIEYGDSNAGMLWEHHLTW